MRLTRAFVSLVLFICIVSFAAPAQKRQRGRVAKPRQPVPVVSAIDAEKLKSLLTEQRQRPLLVNFWATWCDPCRDEFPDLVKIDSEYRPNSLDFVTISLDELSDIGTSVPKFLESMKATMPAYLLNVNDPEPAINMVDPKWQGDLPATFLYNAKGEVVYRHFGRVNATELRAAIDKLVKQQAKN
jgi:thiol-disulfide isomerase/thioredoxin